MFTLIKIAYHQALHGRNVEKIGRRPVIGQHQPSHPAEGEEPLNPWETELSRIAGSRGEPSVPLQHFKGRLCKPPTPDKPKPGYTGKQGTLTDLKIWWDKAAASKPGEMDIKSFAPAPRRHQTRWWQ